LCAGQFAQRLDEAFAAKAAHKGRRRLAPSEADTRGLPVVCLWSRRVGANGEELLSFAAITDERPPEVSAAGHDRCIVPIPAKSIDAWLCPDRGDLASLYAILDDRERPY